MKYLMIYPPQWIPFNPHLAPAAIQSILVNNGNEVHLRDLNVEFYNKVLNPEFIYKSLDRAFKIYNANAAKVFGIRQQRQNIKEFDLAYQNIFNRFIATEKVAKQNEYNFVLENIQKAQNILRDKKQFYNLHQMEKAFNVINKATNILSDIYYPSKLNFININAKSFHSLEELKQNCTDKEGNIFYNYFEELLPELIDVNADCIGISLGDYTQLVPALTLAMMLKAKTKAHISIGGNLFGRYTDILINNPEFFRFFADSMIYNEGEKPLLELIKHLKGEISIDKVPNLIYLDNDQVKINKEEQPIPANELFAPDFTNFPLNLYYTPEVIFNIQASRNCYWRKCAFCTHHFGSKYAVKSVNTIIEELKSLINKNNASYFHFVDEAMSPAYLEKLSKKIIKEGLKINFYIYARFEKEFTPELFKLAREAGLRFILWGFESANERIYTLMNKGSLTCPKAREKILQASYDADIWNHLFIMFGFPSETYEEGKETVDFLAKNRKITSHSTGGKFVLLEDAPILNDLEKYYITKVQKVRAGFSFAHRFETSHGMSDEEYKELEKYKKESWNMQGLKYFDTSYREKVFLYVCKYGTKNISRMKDKIWL
ncbi:MAG: radical SAM protein [bacterium]